MKSDDLRAAWERGTPMEVDRRRGSSSTVLSVRLPDQTFVTLTNAAKMQGKAASTFAREIIEGALSEGGSTTPDYLARLFVKWVGETYVPSPVSEFEITYTSPTVSQHVWISRDAAWGIANYEFANLGLFKSGYVSVTTVNTATGERKVHEGAA
jgi:hypothetical protein